MAVLTIAMLGKFCARCGEQEVVALYAPKVQELFSFLLLHRDRPHARESLAGALWSSVPTAQSKKHLRQTLWHLQSILNDCLKVKCDFLRAEPDWIQLDTAPAYTLDVADFEGTFVGLRGQPSDKASQLDAQALTHALQLYRGDLLEGWYQDWCLFERERLQNMYMTMLDKMMSYCEAQADYAAGLAYGAQILHYDPAHERTHVRLMRLYLLLGDRTAALRQYDRCVAALRDELNVEPALQTMALYEQIRADRFDHTPGESSRGLAAIGALSSALPGILGQLRQIQQVLIDVQRFIQRDMRALEKLRQDGDGLADSAHPD